ncbi:MAG TPA: lipoate--protein ligase family protein [Rhabdochlamydiaceae bacterium]|jgi:lipoate-protein ligase A
MTEHALHLLHLTGYPIYDQLLLEEALLRTDERNWCILNEGSPPAIVMGISGKKEELIDCQRVKDDGIPVIKRFSGGGTVIVDENTLFVTLICQKNACDFPAYPEPILRWHEGLYREVFPGNAFGLRENDFVLGDKKCGGNAQYIKKERWLHHTSFLWDYCPEKMSYLLLPKKAPQYRQQRTHTDFLCRLAPFFVSKEAFLDGFKNALKKRFSLQICSIESVLAELEAPDRQATVLC